MSRFLPFITLRKNLSCVYFVALRIADTDSVKHYAKKFKF